MCRCLDSLSVCATEVYLSNHTNTEWLVHRVPPHEYSCRYPYTHADSWPYPSHFLYALLKVTGSTFAITSRYIPH